MKPHEVTSQWWDHATLWNAADPHLEDAGHTTDGGRVFGITRLRYEECNRYGCKPVAVVDYDDHEQVERLAEAFWANWSGCDGSRSIGLRAALRDFADPKPPRPDEPLGLGAVVEDEDGMRWLRRGNTWLSTTSKQWVREDEPGFWTWSDIAAVRVLSEGVVDQ